MAEEEDECIKPFSRSDVLYNRDVGKLAEKFGKNTSDDAIYLYRKSVSGISIPGNENFGRRLSILSTDIPSIVEPTSDNHFEFKAEDVLASTTVTAPIKSDGPKWMLKKEIFTSPKFIIFMMHGVFHYLALYLPFEFLPSQMVNAGLSHSIAGRVMSSTSIAGLAGRLVCGFLMDHPKIGVLGSYSGSQLIVGLAILCFQFCMLEV